MPMFDGLLIPANAMTVVEKMIDLATFDLIPTDAIDDLIYEWPDIPAFSTNFEMAGVESVHLLAEIGFPST